MQTLGWIFFFFIFFLAMWVLMFLFTVVIPGSLKLFFINKIAPRFIRELAGLEEDK
ncbi:MAG: hypothetical protein RQ875_00110 [Vicingaceae bacterium]|nr:hypothetical protein [Vicingaceae bacterium]